MDSNVSELNQVGIELGSGSYGDASGAFTRGLLVNNFQFGPGEQTVEPVVESRGDYRICRVSEGMINYPGTLGFDLDVGGSSQGGIGDFLASCLGLDTGSDLGGGLFKHIFTVLADATPPWLNLWSDKDAQNREYDGFYVTSIKFSFSSENGRVPIEVTGLYKTQNDLTSQVLTFECPPLIKPNLISAFTVGGASVTNFKSCEITLTNETEGFAPLQNGKEIAQAYRKNFRTVIALSGIDFANETERQKFVDVESTGFVLTAEDDDSNYIKFTYPQCFYQSWEGANISGSDLKTINCNLLVTGDNANNQIEIQNEYSDRYDTGAAIT